MTLSEGRTINFHSLKTPIILIPFLLATWLCAFTPVQAAVIRTEPVSLQDLRERGLSIHTRKRFHVVDITVEDISVMELFKPDKDEESHWVDHFTEKTIHFIIDSQGVDELATKLKEHKAVGLSVILLDKLQIWRWVPWNDYDELHKREFLIPIKTTCEEITNIFYREIVSTVKEQFELAMAGGTNKPVNINVVFSELVKGKIEDYITTLEAVNRDSKCQTTFELLQWLKGGEAAGFESGKYFLREDLQAMLQTVESGAQTIKDEWSQYILEIRIVGFADQHNFKHEIPLLAEQTGIYWGNVKDPPDVHYSGCRKNELDTPSNPVYIDFDTARDVSISTIENNCQLGAVRAYVAMIYLFNRLGASNTAFSYATGGVHPTATRDADKRKVEVELMIKAARTSH